MGKDAVFSFQEGRNLRPFLRTSSTNTSHHPIHIPCFPVQDILTLVSGGAATYAASVGMPANVLKPRTLEKRLLQTIHRMHVSQKFAFAVTIASHLRGESLTGHWFCEVPFHWDFWGVGPFCDHFHFVFLAVPALTESTHVSFHSVLKKNNGSGFHVNPCIIFTT